MNKLAKQNVLVAAMALGVSGIALAHGDDRGCSVDTLQGLYIFSTSGFNIDAVSGVAQPKAIVEVIRFNGDGTLTVPAATRSIDGVIGRSPPGGTGSYAVLADCTGTLAFNGGPSFDIFVPPNGDELWMIQTNSNTVFQGNVVRVSR
jgi:hypothetical protein